MVFGIQLLNKLRILFRSEQPPLSLKAIYMLISCD